jgi:hypothetical protein
MVPQLAAFAAQVVGTQVIHLLLLQTSPAGQPALEPPDPQLYLRPATQASLTCPHSAPAVTQAAGTLVLAGQAQLSKPPQPSDNEPQVPEGKSVHFFLAQVSQVNVIASQTSPAGQLPQAAVLPQPSGTLPQRPVQDTVGHATHWLDKQWEPTAQLLPQAIALLQASTAKPQALVPQAAVCVTQAYVLGSQI